jgi:5-amino-6-(5-phosphoribosylamino)uracil reductase
MNDLPAIQQNYQRPVTTVVLALSLDGKIADYQRSPARFGSANDKAHLEQQIAAVDAVLFGAGTLRAYGTTLSVTNPTLLQQRQQIGLSPQPIQIVCSSSGKLDPEWRFFRQSVPRWLLTTFTGAALWQTPTHGHYFKKILTIGAGAQVDWQPALHLIATLGIRRLAVLGGGTLIGALLAANLIDELWITICPLILGGTTAPTLAENEGFLGATAPRLQLLETRVLGDEVFLHYCVRQKD